MLRRPVLAWLGFTAFGASMLLHGGPARFVVALLTAPLAAAIALLSLLPALYLVANFRASAPPLPELLSAARETFEDAGVLLLGFAPASAFLVSSWGAQGAALVAAPMLFLVTRVASAAFARRYAIGTLRIAAWMCFVTATSVTLLNRWMPQ